ncbi:retention module-containing protein, partial [Vibrio anguillarum]|uniref:retention module-containing protein n=1 Tax=Vibrio anguillarum TaxID=55601 RepID=UPI0030EC7DDC
MELGSFSLGTTLTFGQMIVVDANGNVRVLQPGEKTLPGEIIISASNATQDDVGNNNDVQISRVNADGRNVDITNDINEIFAALEQGQDPTQLGEDLATAAGESNGSSPTGSVSIARDASETIAATEFSTSALTALGLSETQSLTLLESYSQSALGLIVTGTNDAPVAAADVEAGATEGGDVISGTVTATDVDTAQGDLTYSLVDANGDAASAPAGFTLTGNAWTFDPKDAAYDSLAVGETTDVEVTVQVADGQGGTDTQTITITVTGTNDAPVAAADVEAGATEGGDVI